MTFHPSSNNDLDMSPSSIPVPPAFAQRHTSPIRFATTTNAFGLNTSPSSSTSPVREYHLNGPADIPPPTAGTVTTRRLRRPSMLSLAQNAESSEEVTPLPGVMVQDPSSSKAPYHQPQPRWGPATFLVHEAIPRHSSAPPPLIKGLSTSTPPIPLSDPMDEGSGSHSPVEMDGIDGPLRWMPNHLPSSSRRKGKARMSDALSSGGSTLPTSLHAPPFTGRPLPAPLLATLISESSPLEHEMRSEARLQRLLTSHPQALPLTPRAPRSSRGRFPEMVGGDDDDDDDPGMCRPSWARMSSWMNRASSSDSDSDEMVTEDPPEPVNSAFASGMDMDRHMPDIDRPTSSSSSCIFGESGKSTPGQSRSNSGSAIPCPTPPQQSAPWPKAMRMSFGSAGAGMVPSPGGLGLPSAFGGLGMGGISTPSGSPTIERLELAASLGATASPGMMQYRDASSSSVRPGKRKAQTDDRFDPYKRPRGSSPSLVTSSPAFPLSPSRSTTAMTIPQSPGHPPLYPSTLSTSIPTRHSKPHGHPYTRPMASRSRAASPALSTGSRASFTLGQLGAGTGLGGLGLLSLTNGIGRSGRKEDGVEEGEEMVRGDSGESREAMEED